MKLSFQDRLRHWVITCLGLQLADNPVERNHRFLEEALELIQATGCTQKEAHQLVDYVFSRPIGEPSQEVGGVLCTLAALCSTHKIDMDKAGEAELARIWTKIEQVRVNQAAKPVINER